MDLTLADLRAASLVALDWPLVTDALARHARTARGARRAQSVELLASPEQVLEAYAAVLETRALEDVGERLPVGAVGDIGAWVERASRGVVLDGPELRDASHTLLALAALRGWLDAREALAPRLHHLAAPIRVDPALSDLLDRSFEPDGRLSGKTWPLVAELRERIAGLKARIRSTLDELVSGDSLSGALMDRYYTERDGRFVLPVKAGSRRGLGIVHGASQSGETVYVEPTAVVELDNDLKEAEAALLREERRIYADLSRRLGQARPEIDPSLQAAEDIDLSCARAGLGEAWRGVVPTVGGEGRMRILAGRHPVLVLRGIDVVPNDLSISADRPGLVLSGPNTGGKTIALKLLGLCALLVRAAVPLPVREDSRVDVFPEVLATIGDLQTVEGDLSTFSGHLRALRAVFGGLQPGALVLLDEIGVGTDPAQGAALARASLEWIIDKGARVAVTTHYNELKALPLVDPRFEVGGMQHLDGRPTWRVVMGEAGQSHALTTAARLELPPLLVQRARDLLDVGARHVSELAEALDEERAQVLQRRDEADAALLRLAFQERDLQQRELRLEERRSRLEQDVAAKTGARLKAREDEVRALVAALQADPDLARAGRTLDQIRAAREDLRSEPPAPPPPPAELAVGDVVVVPKLGQSGKVETIDGRGRVGVRVGRMLLTLRRDELGEGQQAPAVRAAPKAQPPAPTKERARAVPRGEDRQWGGMRLDHNTADLRGLRVDEALLACELVFDAVLQTGEDTAWVLHGHGTGALKQAVRAWLPQQPHVKRFRPADAGEGGDAYTVVQLR